MDLQELSNAVKKFCEDRDWDQFHTPKDLSIGIVTEASELLDHFRFLSKDQISDKLANPESKQEISDELADTFFFVLRFAQMNDIDLSSALLKKIEKNAEKYPIEKSKGSNKKYTEL